jgi:hypothetical protein
MYNVKLKIHKTPIFQFQMSASFVYRIRGIRLRLAKKRLMRKVFGLKRGGVSGG